MERGQIGPWQQVIQVCYAGGKGHNERTQGKVHNHYINGNFTYLSSPSASLSLDQHG